MFTECPHSPSRLQMLFTPSPSWLSHTKLQKELNR